MNQAKLVLAILLTTLIFAAACTATNDKIPSSPPGIRGEVTSVGGGRIVVEEKPAEKSGSAKASVRLAPDTVVALANGKSLGTADLRKGQIVKVWFSGPIMESYPVQATAGKIVVE